MVKKKNKQKFKPVDLNNLPTSSTKTAVKTSNDVNTSSKLSVTSSKANESLDSISMQYDEISSDSKSDSKDDSFQSLKITDDDHNKTSENNAARGSLTRCNTSEESRGYISRGRHSDDVTDKFQHVTIDSQVALKSDSSDQTQKRNYDDTRRRTSYNRGGGNYKNYNKKTSPDFYKDDRPNQHHQYNRKNENRYDSIDINDRNIADKPSNNFNKSGRTNQYSNNYRGQNKYDSTRSNEYRNRKLNVWAQRSENRFLQTKHEVDGNKVEYNHSASGIWKGYSSEEIPSTTDSRSTKGYSVGQNEEENWDDNEQGTLAENETTNAKDDSNSWDDSNATWNDNTSKDDSAWNTNSSKDDSAWNTNSSKDDSAWNTNCSRNDSAWDDDASGTELNANAKAFVPIPSGQERTENVKGELGHTQYTTSDDLDRQFSNNYPRKSEKPFQEKQQRSSLGKSQYGKTNYIPSGQERTENVKGELGHTQYTTSDDLDRQFSNNYPRKSEKPFQEKQQRSSLGKSQYGKTNYDEDWRTKGASHYNKRNSEGNNWDKKENSKVTRQSYPFDRSSEKGDDEYRKFLDEERNCDKIEFLRVIEKQQDLFAMGKEYSLAHCVAEDLRMGSGIAVSFKRDFKDIDVLLNQRQKQGGLAVLESQTDEGVRYIYYLVTKRVSNGKPTYETLWSSLKNMRDHIRDWNVEKLAIPRLGCGLDRLEWSRVKHMIEFLFREVEVEIVVCNFQQTDDSPEKPLNQTCKVVNVKKPIADIEEETTIIYLSSGDGHVSTEMEQLSKKFSFLDEFRRARKQLGDVVKYEVPKKYYVLYGCIVRKTQKDPFDFVSFRKCVSQIDRNSKKDKYFYVAIQAIKDDNDDLMNDKLVTILRNYLHKMELYVCWDGDLVSQMPLPPPQ